GRSTDSALFWCPGGLDRRADESAAQGTVVHYDDRRSTDSRLPERDGLGFLAPSEDRAGERSAVEHFFGRVGADQHREPGRNGFRAGSGATSASVTNDGADVSLDQP